MQQVLLTGGWPHFFGYPKISGDPNQLFVPQFPERLSGPVYESTSHPSGRWSSNIQSKFPLRNLSPSAISGRKSGSYSCSSGHQCQLLARSRHASDCPGTHDPPPARRWDSSRGNRSNLVRASCRMTVCRKDQRFGKAAVLLFVLYGITLDLL
jgi:hypothetical protein